MELIIMVMRHAQERLRWGIVRLRIVNRNTEAQLHLYHLGTIAGRTPAA